jgi:hypothetical protein
MLLGEGSGRRAEGTSEGIRANTPRDVLIAAMEIGRCPSGMYLHELKLLGNGKKERVAWSRDKAKNSAACWHKDPLTHAFTS